MLNTSAAISSGFVLKPAQEGLAALVIFLLLAGALSSPRLANPSFGTQGDLPVHYHLARAYRQSFAEGDWLPRWAGLQDGGRGDAFFTFYPPLCYWLITVVARALRTDLLVGLKFVTFLGLLLAQLSAYLFARAFFSQARSLVAAALYVLLPAYSLIVLHRAFLPNGLALSFVPLALLATHWLLRGEKVQTALSLFAFSVSASVCTHVLTTYLCALAVGLMLLCHLPGTGWAGLKNLLLASTLAFALTAFFLVPQYLELSWVKVNLQTTQQDFRHYFLFASAPDDSRFHQAWAGINQVASALTLLQTSLGLLIGLALWRKPLPQSQRFLLRYCLAFTVFGLVIALPVSRFLWEWLPGLAYLQFPWRWQPLVALGGGLLAACWLANHQHFNPRRRNLLAAGLTWLLLIGVALTFLIVKSPAPTLARAQLLQALETPALAPLTIEQLRELEHRADFSYLASTANQVYFRPHSADTLLYTAASTYGGLAFVNGRGQILWQQLTNQRREFRLFNEEPVRVRLATYAYPHWVARLDGRAIAIAPEPDSGLMLVDLPAGEHRLTFDYEVRQPLVIWARRISAMTWLGFLAWWFAAWSLNLRRRVSR